MSSIDLATTPVRGMSAGRIPMSFQFRALVGVDVYGAPIPPAERVILTDISHWDVSANFTTMYNAGARGSYFKATQGTSLPDDHYRTYVADIADKMPWGAYHFLTTEVGSLQANFFANHVEADHWRLPPVLDVELPSVASSLIKSYCIQHYSRLHCYPVIYTSAYFWNLVTGTDKTWLSNNCPLWVAHWGADSPILPAGWTDYVMHQYSADGNNLGATFGVGSRDIDLDRCRRSWFSQYYHEKTVEERLTVLEREAREAGWDV